MTYFENIPSVAGFTARDETRNVGMVLTVTVDSAKLICQTLGSNKTDN